MNKMGDIPRESVSKIVIHSNTDLEVFSRVKIHWLEITDGFDMNRVIKWVRERLNVTLLYGKKYKQL